MCRHDFFHGKYVTLWPNLTNDRILPSSILPSSSNNKLLPPSSKPMLLQSRPARPATQQPPIRLRRRRLRSTRDPPRRRRVADSTTTTTTNPTVRPLPRRIPLRAAAARATDRDRARILPTDRALPRLPRRKTRLATPLGRNPTPSRCLLAGGLINEKQATHPGVCRLFFVD